MSKIVFLPFDDEIMIMIDEIKNNPHRQKCHPKMSQKCVKAYKIVKNVYTKTK